MKNHQIMSVQAYVYSQGDASGRKLSVTVNGTAYTTTPSAFPTYFIAGQNYLAIPGVTDGSGNLSLTYDVAADEANLNGIQLIVGRGALAIATQPTNQAVAVGGAVNLSVTASGVEPLAYQWFKNGAMILGATHSTLTLTSAAVPDSGVYYVAVTNPDGLSISQPVTVTVGVPQLLAWGLNGHGQLGDGTTTSRSTAASVASNVVSAAAGENHSLFVKGDHTVWAMGYNFSGQLGDGTTLNRTNPVSVASNVVAVAAGQLHSLCLKCDGTLWAMGANFYGQLGDGTGIQRNSPVSVASNVVAVAAGYQHSLYLKNDGTLWAMGYNDAGQLGDGTGIQRNSPVSVASNVVAVTAGWHSLYLKRDGTLWAMGYNRDGALGDGTTLNRSNAVSVASNVVAMAAGAWHSLYLQSDGTLRAMGANYWGELGDGTTVNRSNAVTIAKDVLTVAAGGYHSEYLKRDGTLWAMGYNDAGQLGDGTTSQQNSPVSVPDLSQATVLSASSSFHTLAVGASRLIAPSITTQPARQAVAVGETVDLRLYRTIRW